MGKPILNKFSHVLPLENKHCMKSVRIRSYSGPHFSAFGLNAKTYGVSFRIRSECWKKRTKITPEYGHFSRSERVCKMGTLTRTRLILSWQHSVRFKRLFWCTHLKFRFFYSFLFQALFFSFPRCSENMQQIYRRTSMPKSQSNFIEITFQHGCSPANLLHIFRTPFPKNTSR